MMTCEPSYFSIKLIIRGYFNICETSVTPKFAFTHR